MRSPQPESEISFKHDRHECLYQVHLKVDGTLIGTVWSSPSSKTGFRHNRCVGQVPCTVWEGETVRGNPTQRDVLGLIGGPDYTRRRAGERLLTFYKGGA